jgi:hypothetical protein
MNTLIIIIKEVAIYTVIFSTCSVLGLLLAEVII